MSDHRRISDSPYNEDEYLGIRPPQPKMRSHHDARSRHRSRSAGRRLGKEGSDVGDWDRHQNVMRRERKRLREKKELSRRAQELFQEGVCDVLLLFSDRWQDSCPTDNKLVQCKI